MSAVRRRRGYPSLHLDDVCRHSFATVVRNLSGCAFPRRDASKADAIVRAVADALEAEVPGIPGGVRPRPPARRRLVPPPPPDATVFELPTLNAEVVVNGTDHVCVISRVPGNDDIPSAYEAADAVETMLGRHLSFAWRPDIGYLTACPDDVGTGLRAGAMLHLEGLHLIGELEPCLRGLQAMRMAATPLDLGGIRQAAHVFAVANAVTLGETEQTLVARSARAVEALADQELNARRRLVEELPRVLSDSISRALAMLKCARLLSPAETLDLLSPVRLGATLGFLSGIAAEEIDALTDALPLFEPEESDADARDAADGARADEYNRRFARVAPNSRYSEYLS